MIEFASYDPHAHGTPLTDAEVRPATASDLDACAALLAAREGDEDPGHWRRRLQFWLASGEALFVADRAGEVVGYARVSWLTPVQNGGHSAPDGYYLTGMVVDPRYRRRGVGRALTQARCDWARERGESTFFVVNATNLASIDLHGELGFREVTRDFAVPGVTFTGGEGILFAADGRRATVTSLANYRARGA